MRCGAAAGRLEVSTGRALRDLAGREEQDRGDQVDARLRPGTEWFVTGNAGEQRGGCEGAWLEIEREFQPCIHLGHQAGRDLTNTFGKVVLVQGDHLRHNGRRVLWQTRNL